jgi:hypothetical protein
MQSPVTLSHDAYGQYFADICANDTTISIIVTTTNPNVSDITITNNTSGASWSTASSPSNQTNLPLPAPGTGQFTIVVTSQNSNYSSSFHLDMRSSATTTTTTTTAAPGVVCFLGSAPVSTPDGPRRIDSLHEGDLVLTSDGEAVAIKRVKAMRVRPGPSTNPYVIAAGQFGATEELLISPRHRVATAGGAMVEARALGLVQKAMRAPFNYYNIELSGWVNMRVAGVEVESLAPAKRVVATADQFRAAIAKLPKTAETAKLLRRVCQKTQDGKFVIFG